MTPGPEDGGPPDDLPSVVPDHVDNLVPFLSGRESVEVEFRVGEDNRARKRMVGWDTTLGGNRVEFEQEDGFRVTLDVERDIGGVWG
jgi:hypothetical protein